VTVPFNVSGLVKSNFAATPCCAEATVINISIVIPATNKLETRFINISSYPSVGIIHRDRVIPLEEISMDLML